MGVNKNVPGEEMHIANVRYSTMELCDSVFTLLLIVKQAAESRTRWVPRPVTFC